MKKGTYIASTGVEGGAVMFRIDKTPYTLRKGSDIEVEILERSKVIFPAEYMTLTLKSESETKNVKKEIKSKKVEEVKVEDKVEPKPTKPIKKASTRKTKSVKIETEEK